jgi:hypothetical protein
MRLSMPVLIQNYNEWSLHGNIGFELKPAAIAR